jgi:VCBS repeat-containing protein
VKDSTISQASLKLGFVLSQERYGSAFEISLKESNIPIPLLGVGRLVETTGEITTMLDAYAATNGGVVQPSTLNFSTLVTGYDFLTDSSEAIRDELNAGTGGIADELIAPRDFAPSESWSADELREVLLGERHDLVYLAGHFSANSALAADYVTRMLTTDLTSSDVDLLNSIIFSAGCHSGYNIVDQHDIPGVTRAPDWAQAFAQKGATLIAGTGYQYGDTDFIEYSERLYLEFSRQLRSGNGTVSIGQALVKAKQIYLATTPQMRGIHEKAFLEATLIGLPMLSVDMPGQRLPASSDPSMIIQTSQFENNPGATLGLRYTDLPVSPQLMEKTVTLTETKLVDNELVTQQYDATYFSGGAGVISNPVEPILPLESYNVSLPGYQTRGVGFRGGTYEDIQDVLPLNGAATTEIRGVHTPFLTDIFFPIRFWGLNYFDTLATGGSGITRLNAIPAQFLSNEIDFTRGTLRTYSGMDFRLYFSNNFETYADGSVPALSGPPTIANVTSVINGDRVDFQITVLGNPAAGIQEVWVTYTATSEPLYGVWQSLDLVQNQDNTLIWEGTLPLNGTYPDDVRFMVQAVNGVGMVSASTNLGLAYIPGVDPNDRIPTNLTLNINQTSAPYGTKPTFSATLVESTGIGEFPLQDLKVLFRLGSQTRMALTDANGTASVDFPLLGLPGDYELKASFPGSATYATANASTSFTITKQDTVITLDSSPVIGSADQEPLVTGELRDATGRRLGEKTLFFTVNQGENIVLQEAIITDYAGRASLGNLPLEPGSYTLKVNFSGNGSNDIKLPDGTYLSLIDDRYNPSIASTDLIISKPPIAEDDNYTTDEDTVLTVNAPGILDNDYDPDGNTLTVDLVSDVSHGTLILASDGSFTYTPSLNYFGHDSFTYTANDGYLDSEEATVNITITAVNDAPSAVNDTYSTTEDTSFTVTAPGVLGNDSDIEGSPLSSTLILAPQNGTLTLETNGAFEYIPNNNFNGTDSFTYKANDGEADSNSATVTIYVGAVNDAPMAVDDSYDAIEDETLTVVVPGVLENDSDPDGDELTVQLSSDVTNGTLNLLDDGSFTYTPNIDFHGIDTFTYVAYDGKLVSNTATVTINVANANDEPDCSEAYPSITHAWPPNGEFVPVYILGITDPDGDLVTITIDKIWQDEPVGKEPDARIVVNSDGSSYAELRVERDGNGDGRVYHIYFTASDGKGGICEGEVVVLIVPHDKGDGGASIDDEPLYNSLIAD